MRFTKKNPEVVHLYTCIGESSYTYANRQLPLLSAAYSDRPLQVCNQFMFLLVYKENQWNTFLWCKKYILLCKYFLIYIAISHVFHLAQKNSGP